MKTIDEVKFAYGNGISDIIALVYNITLDENFINKLLDLLPDYVSEAYEYYIENDFVGE